MRDEPWSRVKEIVHDGTQVGILVCDHNGDAHIERGEETRVENWFGILVEDILQSFSKLDLLADT